MITFTQEIFEKIARIESETEGDFQEIFEAFLANELEKIQEAQDKELSILSDAEEITISKPEDFRYSNPQSATIDNEAIGTIPMPHYLKMKKSWTRIFHVFLKKIEERHKIERVIPYLREIGITVSQGNNVSQETGKTVGGWTSYTDLGLSVKLSGGENFQPMIQKIAEKERIPYSVKVTWTDRNSVPGKYKEKIGIYSYLPTSEQTP